MPVYRNRVFVRLLENTSNNRINNLAYQRACNACKTFYLKIQQFNITKLKVIGTAAFRDSQNGEMLKEELEGILNTAIEILSDEAEAKYIYQGVEPSVRNLEQPYIIMDIGGGSIEFIIVNDNQMLFAKSYPIGLHNLAKMLAYKGLVSEFQYNKLADFCKIKLIEIINHSKELKISTLVGNGGSFEICNAIAFKEKLNSHSNILDVTTLSKYFRLMNSLDIEEMSKIDWIPNNRKTMAPLAFAFIEIVLELLDVNHLIYSPNSVKEGVLLNI